MKVAAAVIGGGFVALLALVLSIAALFGAEAASCTGAVSASDVHGLPSQARPFTPLYVEAAARYELGERGASILAAIHRIESGFGTNMGPSDAGALGQMQFLPSTWSAYGVDADRDGDADPYDAADAIFSAANYLSASGAPADWAGALFAYNHADWYVAEVLAAAKRFGDVGSVADVVCGGSIGAAELDRAVRVYEPARDLRIPTHYTAAGRAPALIDARIWPDVRWVLETYELAVTAGKEGATPRMGMAPRSMPCRPPAVRCPHGTPALSVLPATSAGLPVALRRACAPPAR